MLLANLPSRELDRNRAGGRMSDLAQLNDLAQQGDGQRVVIKQLRFVQKNSSTGISHA